MPELRNIAIIAHVDHGKTTLVDEMLKQCKLFRTNETVGTCILDSNDLERERGITILAKNVSVRYRDVKINIIDTPGHADFGGQVERVLNMADGVLLLVDAAEGPMPQTRFVLDRALSLGLKPLVVINKTDKSDARPDAVHDEVFDLFVELGASDQQLDFPMVYASAKEGWAAVSLQAPRDSILPLLDAILDQVPAPRLLDGPVQMQVTTLDYSDYVGRIGIGRVYRGTLQASAPIALVKPNGAAVPARIGLLYTFEGLDRRETSTVPCGELCAVTGIEGIDIGDTLAAAERPEPLPGLRIDAPTLSMIFRVNDSPWFGREGRYFSSRHLRERLGKAAQADVALQIEEAGPDAFKVSGRGVLHLSVLIENMRREGYEMTVSQPQVIFREKEGRREEPIEVLCVDVPADLAGRVIELVGLRRGEMQRMEQRGARQFIEFEIPTRGMIGLRTRIVSATGGEAVLHHQFLRYGPYRGEVPQRANGVMISMGEGRAVAYALDALQLRGIFFVEPNEPTYGGMIVGEHCIDKDLVVNLQKGKQLTNVRAAGSDRNMKIAPPRRLSLEESLEYIAADELVEATPKTIRLRKRLLGENARKRSRRDEP